MNGRLKNTVFLSDTKLVTGSGAVDFLEDDLKEGGHKNILIITDKGIKSSGILEKVTTIIDKTDVNILGVFDEVQPNPSVSSANETTEKYSNQNIDAIVAVGGGSVLDFSKSIALLLTNGGSIADYFGFDKVPEESIPLYAVATTVGTGSEAGHAAVLTENTTDLKTKELVIDRKIFPKVAYLDGSLLTGMPGKLVASTGMDALTHAIESYVSRNGSHVTDALNLHAVKIIGETIPVATAHTNNEEAMNKMIQASTSTGIAMSNAGLGLVHGISHAVGAQYDAPHGVVNAILLPYVLEYNWIANPQKFADIANALRINTWGKSVEESAKLAVERVSELTREVGIPQTLGEIGVDKEKIDVLADIAINDDLYMGANPRRVTREDIVKILERAI